MDSIDKKIIALLTENSRLPVSDIAEQVGRSRTVIGKRIEQLVTDGEIVKFTLELKAESEQQQIPVLFKIKTAQGFTCHDVVPVFQDKFAIVQAFSISGDWDVIIQMAFATTDEISIAKDFLENMSSIEESVTHLILNRFS